MRLSLSTDCPCAFVVIRRCSTRLCSCGRLRSMRRSGIHSRSTPQRRAALRARWAGSKRRWPNRAGNRWRDRRERFLRRSMRYRSRRAVWGRGPQAAVGGSAQGTPDADGAGDRHGAGQGQVERLDPPEMTECEQTPLVSGQAEPVPGQRVGQRDDDVERAGQGEIACQERRPGQAHHRSDQGLRHGSRGGPEHLRG